MNNKIMVLGVEEGVGKTLVSIGIGKYLNKNNIQATTFKGLEITESICKIDKELIIGYKEKLKLDAFKKSGSIDNNPIVLHKEDDKIKVYVNGEAYAKTEGFDYKQSKEEFEEYIYKSFENLKKNEENNFIILEGTGECLEYVERENEFLNFKIAKTTDSDIILVSKFQDNNSFANLYGTLSLITKEDKKRIKGIIINDFTGDIDYLKKGLTKLEKRTKIPCLGIIPEINTNIFTEEEFGKTYRFDKKRELIIGVVKLPFLSHLSDFYAFEDEKEIKMTLIENPKEIDDIDFIIIPGSKNPIRDLEFLKESGLDKKIIEAANKGKTVMGICGGFQMLGEEIEDLYSLENKGRKLPGLGLIPLKTTYTFVNKTMIAKGNVCKMDNLLKPLSEAPIYGYEAIQGDSDMGEGAKAFMTDKMNNIVGLSNDEGNVFGTFMHGVFESKEFKLGLLDILKERHGVVTSNKELEKKSFSEYKEKRFDEFFKIFEQNIDLEKLNKILKRENM